jgi:DNA-binding CsgD family transcriptional regulator
MVLDGGLRFLFLAAEAALEAGDLDTAQRWIDTFARWADWSGVAVPRTRVWLLRAQHALSRGDHDTAERYARQALTLAREPRQPLELLSAYRVLGELLTRADRYGEAEHHLLASLAISEACAAPFERARGLLALAEWRAATGQPAEARPLAEEIRQICTPLGAAPPIARSTALLATLDRRPRAAAYPAGLTAREVEVLRLVAQGLTDAEVAARLYISRRTVGTHLTAIYTKLDVTSRIDATRIAVQYGLVSP